MTLMGLIVNRQGLYAARWFLGIAEAGVYLHVPPNGTVIDVDTVSSSVRSLATTKTLPRNCEFLRTKGIDEGCC
jgi:hypothetical protein